MSKDEPCGFCAGKHDCVSPRQCYPEDYQQEKEVSNDNRFIMGGMPDAEARDAGLSKLAQQIAEGAITPDKLPKLASPTPLEDPLLHDLLAGGDIERYHIKGKRMLTQQNVAEHSWRMIAIVYYIWPDCRSALLLATAFHDVSERVTGDVPSNVKRANPEIKRVINEVSTAEEIRLGIRFHLVDDEPRLLAFADRYEGALHCFMEYRMGNRLVIPTLNRYLTYCLDGDYVLSNPDREQRRKGLLTRLHQTISNGA